jgi:hypothetical protein
MSLDTIGASVLALGIWVIFSVAIIGGGPAKPQNYLWVASASEMIPSHPDLVRAAPRNVVAMEDTGPAEALLGF